MTDRCKAYVRERLVWVMLPESLGEHLKCACDFSTLTRWGGRASFAVSRGETTCLSFDGWSCVGVLEGVWPCVPRACGSFRKVRIPLIYVLGLELGLHGPTCGRLSTCPQCCGALLYKWTGCSSCSVGEIWLLQAGVQYWGHCLTGWALAASLANMAFIPQCARIDDESPQNAFLGKAEQNEWELPPSFSSDLRSSTWRTQGRQGRGTSITLMHVPPRYSVYIAPWNAVYMFIVSLSEYIFQMCMWFLYTSQVGWPCKLTVSHERDNLPFLWWPEVLGSLRGSVALGVHCPRGSLQKVRLPLTYVLLLVIGFHIPNHGSLSTCHPVGCGFCSSGLTVPLPQWLASGCSRPP